MNIVLGNWTFDTLEKIIRKSSEIRNASRRIDFLSRCFLGMDYRESTLCGDANTPEVFVINLEGVDCFTFIDYIEAMRISGSFPEFRENLIKVRYRGGTVAFKNRNHFFTDWREFNSEFIQDLTEKIGGQKTKNIKKTLNLKKDGTCFLEEIQPMQREIQYIPSDAIDDSVLEKMETGDYAGIYSETEGLDVSHVGIIIKEKDSMYLRHSSSEKKYRKVIDQNFRSYISGTPGLIILRPRA